MLGELRENAMSETLDKPELDPTDPYERRLQTFPSLTAEMVARVRPYGSEEAFAAGRSVFRRDDRSVDFFLVLDGAIEIFDTDSIGTEKAFVTLEPNQFSGELDLFNARQVLVSARTAVESCLLRVKRQDFQRLVVGEPDIGEIIMRAFILRRVGLIRHAHGGVVVVGPGHDGDTLRIERFLLRNGYPHRLLDTELTPDAEGFLTCFDLKPEQLPVVIFGHEKLLLNPSQADLADALGLTETIDPEHVYDVAIVGAGPGGLAAAVYAASEGLDTIVIEALAPGGQAGTSSKIENYLGFPTGISGQALAGRAQIQAQKFGARLAISRAATGLDCSAATFKLAREDAEPVKARAVIVASGARYRKLAVPDYEKFEGQGIHYAATAMESGLCGGEEVIVVGGGNSAGQAAVFLSRTTSHVHILVRAPGLAATMSDYLVRRIEQSAHITLHTHTEITALAGDERLREVTWTDRRSGAAETRRVANVFVMIGAEPNTDWLDGCLTLDAKGFVQTGLAADGTPLSSPYATTHPGIYAIGDVRSGSVKRVASGVGEGSVVIQAVHAFLHPDPA